MLLEQIRNNDASLSELRLNGLPSEYFKDVDELTSALEGNTVITSVYLTEDFLSCLHTESRGKLLKTLGRVKAINEVHLADSSIWVLSLSHLLEGAKGLETLDMRRVTLQGLQYEFDKFAQAVRSHTNLKQYAMFDSVVAHDDVSVQRLINGLKASAAAVEMNKTQYKHSDMTLLERVRINDPSLKELHLSDYPMEYFKEVEELLQALEGNTHLESVRFDEDFFSCLHTDCREKLLKTVGNLKSIRKVHLAESSIWVLSLCYLLENAKELQVFNLESVTLQGLQYEFDKFIAVLGAHQNLKDFGMLDTVVAHDGVSVNKIVAGLQNRPDLNVRMNSPKHKGTKTSEFLDRIRFNETGFVELHLNAHPSEYFEDVTELITALAMNKTIQTVRLDNDFFSCLHTDSREKLLKTCGNLTSLKELHLADSSIWVLSLCVLLTNAKDLQTFGLRCVTLQGLQYEFNQFITALKEHKNLKHFDMFDSVVAHDDVSVQKLMTCLNKSNEFEVRMNAPTYKHAPRDIALLNRLRNNDPTLTELHLNDDPVSYFKEIGELATAIEASTALKCVRFEGDFLSCLHTDSRDRLLKSVGMVATIKEVHLADSSIWVESLCHLVEKGTGLEVFHMKSVTLQGLQYEFDRFMSDLRVHSSLKQFDMYDSVVANDNVSVEKIMDSLRSSKDLEVRMNSLHHKYVEREITLLDRIRYSDPLLKDVHLKDYPTVYFTEVSELIGVLERNTVIRSITLDNDFLSCLHTDSRAALLQTIGKLKTVQKISLGDSSIWVLTLCQLLEAATGLEELELRSVTIQGLQYEFNKFMKTLEKHQSIKRLDMFDSFVANDDISVEKIKQLLEKKQSIALGWDDNSLQKKASGYVPSHNPTSTSSTIDKETAGADKDSSDMDSKVPLLDRLLKNDPSLQHLHLKEDATVYVATFSELISALEKNSVIESVKFDGDFLSCLHTDSRATVLQTVAKLKNLKKVSLGDSSIWVLTLYHLLEAAKGLEQLELRCVTIQGLQYEFNKFMTILQSHEKIKRLDMFDSFVAHDDISVDKIRKILAKKGNMNIGWDNNSLHHKDSGYMPPVYNGYDGRDSFSSDMHLMRDEPGCCEIDEEAEMVEALTDAIGKDRNLAGTSSAAKSDGSKDDTVLETYQMDRDGASRGVLATAAASMWSCFF